MEDGVKVNGLIERGSGGVQGICFNCFWAMDWKGQLVGREGLGYGYSIWSSCFIKMSVGGGVVSRVAQEAMGCVKGQSQIKLGRQGLE